jgi:hypothetical protein
MIYHNAIRCIQDAIDVLGDTLSYPDVRHKYGFDELRQQVLEDALYHGAQCQGSEFEFWKSSVDTIDDLNLQLADLDVAPIVLPPYGLFAELVSASRADAAKVPLDKSELGCEAGGKPNDTVLPDSDFFRTLLDDDLYREAQAHRVAARMTNLRNRRLLEGEAAPVCIVIAPEDEAIVDEAVRMACSLPSFADIVFETFIEKLGELKSWRFDKAAEDAWRAFFTDKVAAALLAEAAL